MEVSEQTPSLDQTPVPELPHTEVQWTKKQIGQMRRQYITITYGTVKACGHKANFSKTKDPGNNCVACWEAFFMTSVDLEGVHAVLSKGAKELIKVRGSKFTKMFHGFLTTRLLPALNAELNAAPINPVQVQGGTFVQEKRTDESIPSISDSAVSTL